MGKQIRRAFVPPDGWRIVTADYSQVELRLLAHFCRDERLLDAFAHDRDVHASVAAEIFKVPEAAVTVDQRRVAKTVNFGVIYGMSASGLAVRLGIKRKDAETFIDEYFAKFAEGARLPGRPAGQVPQDRDGRHAPGPPAAVRRGRPSGRSRATRTAPGPSGRPSTWRFRGRRPT